MPGGRGEEGALRKAVRNIKWRDKVLDLVLKLESDGIENYLTRERVSD